MPNSISETSSTPTTLLLRLAIATAGVGIAAGVVIGLERIEGLFDLLQFPAYSHVMLVPFLLGALAIGLAIVDMVRRDRYYKPAIVTVLGLAAIASPLFVVITVAAMIVCMLIAANVEL